MDAHVSTKPPEYAKSLSFDEARAAIIDAIGISRPEGAPSRWWVDEAVRMILRYRQREEGKTLYDVSTVGARIRTAREIRGLTQVQLAGRIFKRRDAKGKLRKMYGWDIHTWEVGERDIPYELFPALLRALGVGEGWLLGDTDEGGPPMPKGLRVRQVLTNYSRLSREVKDRAIAKAQLERLRGLRGEGSTRIHHLKTNGPEAPMPEAVRGPPSEMPTCAQDSAGSERQEAADPWQEPGG